MISTQQPLYCGFRIQIWILFISVLISHIANACFKYSKNRKNQTIYVKKKNIIYIYIYRLSHAHTGSVSFFSQPGQYYNKS